MKPLISKLLLNKKQSITIKLENAKIDSQLPIEIWSTTPSVLLVTGGKCELNKGNNFTCTATLEALSLGYATISTKTVSNIPSSAELTISSQYSPKLKYTIDVDNIKTIMDIDNSLVILSENGSLYLPDKDNKITKFDTQLKFQQIIAMNLTYDPYGWLCGLSTDGIVYCWGNNYYGAWGIGEPFPTDIDSIPGLYHSPAPINTDVKFDQISIGSGSYEADSNYALSTTGDIYFWGSTSRYGSIRTYGSVPTKIDLYQV